VVEAAEAVGLLRGLATLRQLISAGLGPGATAWLEAATIEDAPRFAWRGLSLDVVRCFFAPEDVRRVLDVMALLKMNVLHLHLTDDQGWRIEIPGWPELTAVGGVGAVGDRPGGSYSQSELAALVTYADERGITIVPEIDMPGHCGAALRARPELAAQAGASLLDPDHVGVLTFVRDVIAAMAEATPGPYLHLGGDEAFGMAPDAYGRFIDAARGIALELGVAPIFWQESARSSIGPGDIVQHWMALDPSLEALLLDGDLDDLAQSAPRDLGIPPSMLAAVAEMFRAAQGDIDRATEAGATVILSPASHLYLDRPYAEAPADPSQTALQERLGLKVYPRRSVAEAYDWDPAASLEGGPSAIAGIEAAIWCETISSIDELEFLLLPRLAGVAERAWSTDPSSTWSEYRGRLGAQAPLWRRRGWRFFTSSLVAWSNAPEAADRLG